MDLKAVQRCVTEARIVCLNPFKLSDVLEDILSVERPLAPRNAHMRWW